MKKASGFTLIELLIVVAIIAILAAIAVPNFLEAQVRAKVSRSVSDMRTLATAIESYAIDWNVYPPSTGTAMQPYPFQLNGNDLSGTLWTHVSTPVAYITNAFMFDVFNSQNAGSNTDEALFTYQNLINQYCGGTSPYNDRIFNWGTRFSDGFCDGTGGKAGAISFYGAWRLGSVGPDMDIGFHITPSISFQIPYDSTNGTLSRGNIWRSQARPENSYANADQYSIY